MDAAMIIRRTRMTSRRISIPRAALIHVGRGIGSTSTLDAVEFEAMLDNVSTALPIGVDPDDTSATCPWKWSTAAQPVAGAAQPQPPPELDMDAEPRNLAMSLKQRLLKQWIDFKANCRPRAVGPGDAADGREFVDSDRFEYDAGAPRFDTEGERVSRLPGWYWIRTRQFWPDLSELMLFWLCAPVSTAGLERGFSFQTLLDQDTRRRLKSTAHMRDDMLVHIFQDWFSKRLAAC